MFVSLEALVSLKSEDMLDTNVLIIGPFCSCWEDAVDVEAYYALKSAELADSPVHATHPT